MSQLSEKVFLAQLFAHLLHDVGLKWQSTISSLGRFSGDKGLASAWILKSRQPQGAQNVILMLTGRGSSKNECCRTKAVLVIADWTNADKAQQ